MSEKKVSFEANMQRLEQIVRAMERGDVALDESLKLFQEGTELVRSCGKLLDEAELQVKMKDLHEWTVWDRYNRKNQIRPTQKEFTEAEFLPKHLHRQD